MSVEQPFRIAITPNGPYVVTGGVPLVERAPAVSAFGEPLAWDPVGARVHPQPARVSYRLCRCGQSQNKPFCDASHTRLGFDGKLNPDADLSGRRAYVGRGIHLTDDARLCVHAGFCGTRFTTVWKMLALTDDPEVRARLIEMVSHCPSGRLAVETAEGEAVEPALSPSIAAIPDGPLWVRGGIPIEAPDGMVYTLRNRMTLCRCGRSKNKPFCDGTHAEVGFSAPGLGPWVGGKQP